MRVVARVKVVMVQCAVKPVVDVLHWPHVKQKYHQDARPVHQWGASEGEQVGEHQRHQSA